MVTLITDISGISDKRAQTLRDGRLGTIPELAAATPEAVREVLVAAGHRVGIATIEQWLSQARAIEAEEWHRAASFVVSFEARGEDEERERRTVVEQTEVEVGPAPTREWRGWECSQVCGWMVDRVAPRLDVVAEEAVAAPPSTAAPSLPSPGTQPGHRIAQMVLIGRAGQRAAVPAGDGPAAVSVAWEVTRVLVTVGSVLASTLVVLRFRNLATGARLVVGPGEVPSDGRVGLEVPVLPPGAYDVAAVAWDENAQAAPHHVPIALVVEPSAQDA